MPALAVESAMVGGFIALAVRGFKKNLGQSLPLLQGVECSTCSICASYCTYSWTDEPFGAR